MCIFYVDLLPETSILPCLWYYAATKHSHYPGVIIIAIIVIMTWRRQAIVRNKVDQIPWRHIVALGYIELKLMYSVEHEAGAYICIMWGLVRKGVGGNKLWMAFEMS